MATTGLYSPHVNHPEKRIARNILLAVILILFALLTLFPIFYMIMSSFGPAVATAGTSRSIFPRVWTLDSYKAFFSFSKYSVRWIVNSLIVASATGSASFSSTGSAARRRNAVRSICPSSPESTTRRRTSIRKPDSRRGGISP